MKQKRINSIKKALCIASLVTACSSLANTVHAEEFAAAKNQFIIEFSEQAKSNPAAIGIKGLSAITAQSAQNSMSPISVVEVDAQGNMKLPSKNPSIENVSEDPEFCKKLIQSGVAKSCSPNFQVKTRVLPNEPGIGNQYWHTAIESSKAWDVTTGSDAAVVAVLDTGVDYRHPDLAQNMWVNTAEIPANGIDDDNNGVIDDVYGYNGEKNNGDPLDDGDHGTHVAGIIGARGNNGIGVAGVAWRTKIMALKFITAAGYGFTSDAIEGMDYMIAMKNRGVNVKVINNSWGGGGFSKPLEDAIKRVNNAGIIFTAAAGNSASDNDVIPQYPASYNVPNIVSVAASDEHNALTGFSCFGSQTVHISAPGSSINSTVTNNRYQQMSGTSMATPFVTGALGLLFSREPNLTAQQAINRLLKSANFQTDQEGLTTTSRMLNVNNLIRNSTGTAPVVGDICQYDVSQITYAPNTAVGSAPIALPAAGSTFYDATQVTLPFEFPFYGKLYKKMHISVNGAVQFENPDNPWDFRGGSFAPRFSIAALYTSLYDYPAVAAPNGVRFKASADRIDVQWEMPHPWNHTAGTLKVNLAMFPNGDIETHLSIPTDRLAKTLSYGSIVGIRGENLANSQTVTANNFPTVLRGNLAFRFLRPQSCSATTVDIIEPTPLPTPIPTIDVPSNPNPQPIPTAEPTPLVESAKVTKLSIVGAQNRSGVVKTKTSYQLRVRSSKQGMFKLRVLLNGKQCDGSVDLKVTQANNTFKVGMPVVGRAFNKMTLKTENKSAKATILGTKLKTTSYKKITSNCKLVLNKLKQAVRTK